MSTKIYYAYRIPKSVDILKELKNAKNIATQFVAEDNEYLKMLHTLFMYNVAKKLEKEPENEFFLSIKKENMKGEFHYHYYDFIVFLKENIYKNSSTDFSTKFECAVFYDNDYWYIKFFPNENIQYKMLDEFEKKLNLEDYHYQNQTDVPTNISEEDYELRNKKWNELTESSDGNYLDGFIYDIMSPDQIKNLITKNFYTGTPLFDHLSYKFDFKYFKE